MLVSISFPLGLHARVEQAPGLVVLGRIKPVGLFYKWRCHLLPICSLPHHTIIRPHLNVVLSNFSSWDKVFRLYESPIRDVTLPDEVLYASYFLRNAVSRGSHGRRPDDDGSGSFGSRERDWQRRRKEGQRRDYGNFRQGGQDRGEGCEAAGG